MTASNRALLVAAVLVCASVLSSTLLIPAVRPFMASVAPGNQSAAHAFMSLNLLGGVLAAPFVARLARASRNPARLAAGFALLDASLLGLLSLGLPLTALLVVRTVQGALNLAVLSVLMGAAPVSARGGRGYGVLGSALMLGVAAGAPLGTLLLRAGPGAPLLAGALIQLAVALALPLAQLEAVRRGDERSPSALPWTALLWVFCERFAIGLFVVTFAFHARQCLASSDAEVGACFSAFMVPFVVAVYPAARLAERVGSSLLAAGGLVVYGVAWLVLQDLDGGQLLALMPVLGVSSAAVFAAAMREAGSAVSTSARIAAMSALNSAGGLGMLLGTALAGVLSATLRARGAADHVAHELTFGIAGLAQLGAALVTAVRLLERRLVRSVRS